MFKHLLVPLDGSQLAEAALPYASRLAQALQAQVTLIHIIEENAPAAIHGERHLRDEEEACRYLEEARRRFFPESVAVTRHVHTEKTRNVAGGIAEHVAELRPDLIVMCTHGKSGLRELVIGSIAQQVIARSRAPVFLVQPSPAPVRLERFLVPLDGNPEHDRTGLPAAAGLALATGAALHLFSVVYTLRTLPPQLSATGKMLPSATAVALNSSESASRDYLARQALPWQDQGIPVTIEVARGEPVQEILEAAQRAGCDLIVLATHGKAGMGAFWESSVAPQVIMGSKKPLLLAPVKP